MKKIIISGSKGFIGNNLKNLFIQNGYEVYGIDKKINHIRMFNHVNTKIIIIFINMIYLKI